MRIWPLFSKFYYTYVYCFAQHHNTTLIVEDLDQLTPEAIKESLNDVDTTPKRPNMGRASSSNQTPLSPVRRSFSENKPPSPPPPITKSTSMFSNFMRRSKKKTGGDSGDEDDIPPPPAPPKDRGSKYNGRQAVVSHDYATRHTTEPQRIPATRRHTNLNMSEFAILSRSLSSDDDEVVIEPVQEEKQTFRTLPLSGKWSGESVDAAERIRRAREEQQRRAIEEQHALREEAKQKAELKRRREQQIQEDLEYEARRRASLEEELRKLTVERKIKEQLENAEEERKRKILEERKRRERERKTMEHLKLEENDCL